MEWLLEAQSQERAVISGTVNNPCHIDDDQITESDSAILNDVTLIQRRSSVVYNST